MDCKFTRRYAWASVFMEMRGLFIELKNKVQERGDIGQENIITSYISLVEYAQLKNEKWYKSWKGWQDRFLLGWRYNSSRFYMSWFRPVVLLVVGYLFLNLIPFLFVGFEGYWEFCLNRPTKILSYMDGLEATLGAKSARYKTVNTTWMSLVGIIRIIWIALCSYAIKNSLKIFGLKLTDS